MKSARGLTLIELLVTVTVAGILLTIAVPSFSFIIRETQLTTQTNEFISHLKFARSEAVKRNTAVRVRSSDDSTDWSDGWQVEVVASAEVLRQSQALDVGVLSGDVSQVSFDSSGFAVTGTAFELCGNDGTSARTIEIAGSGRVDVVSGTCAGS